MRVAFLTPKRLGNAVRRNTMRRRMREVYRRHQDELFPALERRVRESTMAAGGVTSLPAPRTLPSVHAVFICQKADIPTRELELDMRDLMSSFATKAGDRIVG